MRIVILGAGAGACAAAVDLKLNGFDVILCSSYEPDIKERITPIQARGGLDYSGVLGEGFMPIETSTDENEVKAADVIMVVTLANGDEYYASKCGKLISEDQIVFLNPGYIGSSIRFSNIVRANTGKRIKICETNNLPYISRLIGPTHVRIFKKSKFLLFSSFPSKDNDLCFSKIRPIYPFLKLAENVLETGMLNPNIILHPAGMAMNAGWIEFTKGDFFYYLEGHTPAVARVIDSFDEERLNICRAAKVKTMKFVDFYYKNEYTTDGSKGVYEALRNSEPNRTIKAPPSLNHRYVTEDVGYGLVPMAAIGRIARVKTPTMDSLIHLISTMTAVHYETDGLTLEKMNLVDVDLSRLNAILKDGF